MADHRHKRDTDARRRPRATLVAGSLAALATASAVTLGVLAAEAPATEDVSARTTAADLGAIASGSDLPAVRGETLSRSSDRRAERQEKERETKLDRVMAPGAVRAAVRGADTQRWTTAPLNLWTEPGAKAVKRGVLPAERRVRVTGRALWGRVEVVVDGQARWVTAGYLQDEKPEEPEERATTEVAETAACTNGTSVPAGVSPNVAAVHEAVCAAFPDITSYGTFRSDGEHAQGLAIDIMVSGSLGWEVAEFVRSNYAELGVSYLIYAQKIWSVERAGEGWRGMEDRGSATANHYDHVHVTTY